MTENQTANDRVDVQPSEVAVKATSKKSLQSRLLVGLLTISLGSLFVASYFAGQAGALREQVKTSQSQFEQAIANNPFHAPIKSVNASAALSKEKFSMATGFLSDRAEGLFVLDHNSGLLQCSVIYPRMQKFLGLFTVNVHDTLGQSKGGEFMMMTGMVDVPSSNNNPVGSSVVYVMNTSTGMYACYYIPFSRTMMNSNAPQQGALVLLSTGSADPVVNRDNLR